MDIKKRVGKRVRELREGAGLSQDGLAALASLSRVAIGGVERGEKAPGLDTLDKIAAALDVSVVELLDDERPKARPDRPAARIAALMRGASPSAIAKFEKLAQVYFSPVPRR